MLKRIEGSNPTPSATETVFSQSVGDFGEKARGSAGFGRLCIDGETAGSERNRPKRPKVSEGYFAVNGLAEGGNEAFLFLPICRANLSVGRPGA